MMTEDDVLIRLRLARDRLDHATTDLRHEIARIQELIWELAKILEEAKR